MSQEQPPFGLPGPILAEIQRRPRSRIKFSWPPSVVSSRRRDDCDASQFHHVSPPRVDDASSHILHYSGHFLVGCFTMKSLLNIKTEG